MTREEAICELSVIWERLSHPEDCENGCYSFRDGDYLEALDMAIEALSAPSGDLISRKSLNDIKFIAIKGDKVEEAYRSGWNGAIECIIENAPSAEPTGDLISRADAIEAVRLESAKRGSLGRGDILNVLSALPSAEQVTSKLNNPCNSLLTDGSNGSKEHKSKLDLISRQDVIDALCRSSVYAWSIEQDQTAHDWALNIIKALPSADAETTVIRSRTLLPTKDFKEWAKRIREENPNAVVIPCDAEVVSANSVVRCKDCRHQEHCHETVAHTKDHDGFREHWSEPIEWCSRGERREP